MKGAYKISDAGPTISVACDQCDRRGRYSTARLIAKHGDITLPELLGRIKKESGCRQDDHNVNMHGCMARYTGLPWQGGA